VDRAGNLYAGGSFALAGDVQVNHIARWDGSTWSTLDGGMRRDPAVTTVSALAVDGAGTQSVYAGGSFTRAGDAAASFIATWKGGRWSPVGDGGSGLDGNVHAIASDGSGNVYVGGDFTTAGGLKVNSIARWDGSRWHPLGTGVGGGGVAALALDGSGNVYAGGWFSTAGGVDAMHIARWDGSRWHALGSGIEGGDWGASVRALAIDRVGDVYAGGEFAMAGGVEANHIARWDGSRWHALGSGLSGGTWGTIVHALVMDGTGNLVVGGSFISAGGVDANNVARWDGVRWSALGAGTDETVTALAVDGAGTQSLYAGGTFTSIGSTPANRVARWDGVAWHPLQGGVTGDQLTSAYVSALAIDGWGTQSLYAGGARHIARWDGSGWQSLGTGMNGPVNTLLVDQGSTLYAGGNFTTAGGKASSNIASSRLHLTYLPITHGGAD
jgi:trimeric autotransporter adhesin